MGMKIAIVGATGFVGAKLLAEAVSRGHQVTAITRSPEKLRRDPHITAVAADVNDVPTLIEAFRGQEAVIHSYAPARKDSIDARIAQQRRATTSIIAALRGAGVRRILAVGGAGTSEIAPGVKLMDSYLFPKAYEGGAKSTAVIKDLLKAEPDLDWIFLSPPHALEAGTRTGKYRLGRDNLIFEEATGRSHISVDDYAVAMIDELENPRHSRERFTVGT
jgi:uncharacterized protein